MTEHIEHECECRMCNRPSQLLKAMENPCAKKCLGAAKPASKDTPERVPQRSAHKATSEGAA